MVSPEFLLSYAHSKGINYLYDANNDGVIDTRDVDLIKSSQIYQLRETRVPVKPVFHVER